MRKIVFVLGIIGSLVGVGMMIAGKQSRHYWEPLIIYGLLIAAVSLLVTFVAKIIISQRG